MTSTHQAGAIVQPEGVSRFEGIGVLGSQAGPPRAPHARTRRRTDRAPACACQGPVSLSAAAAPLVPPRESSVGRMARQSGNTGIRASIVASGPASSDTHVFNSRTRSGNGLTSDARPKPPPPAIDTALATWLPGLAAARGPPSSAYQQKGLCI
jgi:hypothetical protein